MTLASKDAHKFSVAPMMDWTDRHCRMFHRMLSKHALLYTEMVVADAVIHGDQEYLIGFDEREQPVALQIGGSEPVKLAEASKIGEDFGYREININIGCPSDRVQSGRFGACLMAEPELVADCYAAMASAVDIPVTVKCRLGIDQQDAEQTLPHFIETVKNAGCTHFIIHARKAWLDGLSPKENRTVPPLDYDLVRRMKAQFPDLTIILNGGLEDLQHARDEMGALDGVMFGRAAYHTPWILTEVDAAFFDGPLQNLRRRDIVTEIVAYLKSVEKKDRSAKAMIRHIMGLYHGEPGARIWRRALSEADPSLAPSEKVAQAFDLYTQFLQKAA
ncbi:MAG: tRNA dihydrouridine(20/20a) synthase DusA [Hyphomonadaceae bacterium]|nr:tRNA dihydrouridine(20/20a) synthase DusA [Hyphomonadaceae bacterium]